MGTVTDLYFAWGTSRPGPGRVARTNHPGPGGYTPHFSRATVLSVT